MDPVLTRRVSLLIAAVLTMAAAYTTTATFGASTPGADLQPQDGAQSLVSVLQGTESIVWTSLEGPVLSYRVEGWPVEMGGDELGGALVLERPDDPTAGVIDFAEKPRTLSFRLGA